MSSHPRHFLCAALSTTASKKPPQELIRTQLSCNIFGHKYTVPVRTSSGRLLFIFAETTFNTVHYSIKSEFPLHRRRLHRRSLPHHLFDCGGCSLPAGRVSGNGKKKALPCSAAASLPRPRNIRMSSALLNSPWMLMGSSSVPSTVYQLSVTANAVFSKTTARQDSRWSTRLSALTSRCSIETRPCGHTKNIR